MKSMRYFFLCFTIIIYSALQSQSDFYHNHTFTYGDTLRGSLRPERTCFDVQHYGLFIKMDPKARQIQGHVDISYQVVEDFTTLQIDLFENMAIDKIVMEGNTLEYDRQFNAVFVHFPRTQYKGTKAMISVYYQGEPTVADNPPWDGGVIWAKDKRGRPWYAVSCEGTGASLWWPNKDHLTDEPDSMLINIAVPSNMTAICNGNLRSVVEEDKFTQYEWAVTYPIDNYNVTFNVGHYTQFSDTYYSFDGDSLALDYYVMDYNLEKAQKHFEQTKGILECYDHYMGKYPFWEDGFALVETPYLGMEHQGAIAYGNRYMRGYLGGMIPLDMNWDYIIVHETGHEYFGNSIGCGDLSEMWIQESFTTYLESLYVEYTMSTSDAVRYLEKQKLFINNKNPLLGPKDVNWKNWSDSDNYFKGAWVLHTLRNAIGNDDEWFRLFHLFYQQNKLSIISSSDIIDFYNKETGRKWDTFFEQYLCYPAIPILEYKLTKKRDELRVSYRWDTDVEGFEMPILIGTDDRYQRVTPSDKKWQELVLLDTDAADFKVATELFLVKTKDLSK